MRPLPPEIILQVHQAHSRQLIDNYVVTTNHNGTYNSRPKFNNAATNINEFIANTLIENYRTVYIEFVKTTPIQTKLRLQEYFRQHDYTVYLSPCHYTLVVDF